MLVLIFVGLLRCLGRLGRLAGYRSYSVVSQWSDPILWRHTPPPPQSRCLDIYIAPIIKTLNQNVYDLLTFLLLITRMKMSTLNNSFLKLKFKSFLELQIQDISKELLLFSSSFFRISFHKTSVSILYKLT
jgi:hypothetical protein